MAYIDLEGHARVLREFEGTSFAIPAPDGKRLAFVDFLVSSNAGILERFLNSHIPEMGRNTVDAAIAHLEPYSRLPG